jgi:hypothetical protein
MLRRGKIVGSHQLAVTASHSSYLIVMVGVEDFLGADPAEHHYSHHNGRSLHHLP